MQRIIKYWPYRYIGYRTCINNNSRTRGREANTTFVLHAVQYEKLFKEKEFQFVNKKKLQFVDKKYCIPQ